MTASPLHTSEGAKKVPLQLPPVSDGEFKNIVNIITSSYTQRHILQKKVKNITDNVRSKQQSINSYHTRLQQKIKHSQLHHIFDTNGNRELLDSLLNGPTKDVWATALTKELGRLAQGIDDIAGNDCIDFICKSEIPHEKKITYANMVYNLQPLKAEKYCVRLTVGGDCLDYHHDATSPAASLIETKMLLNSVISDSARGTRFLH